MVERRDYDPSGAVQVHYPYRDPEGTGAFRVKKLKPGVPHGAKTFDRGSVRAYLKGRPQVGVLERGRSLGFLRRSPETNMQYETHPVRDRMRDGSLGVFGPQDWDAEDLRAVAEVGFSDFSEE